MKAVHKWIIQSMFNLQDKISRRLVNKLILFFSTIIILLISVITFISYQMIQKESVTNSVNSTTNNLLLVNRNLEGFLSDVEQLSLPQIRYDEINNAILTEATEYGSRMYLEQYLRSLYYSRNDLQAIYLYLVDEHKYYSITREAYDTKVRTEVNPSIPNQSWYQEALASDKNRAFQSFILPAGKQEDIGYPVSRQDSFMAYHRVLRSIANRQPQAVLSFYFKPSVKDEILKDVPFSEGEHLLFLDPDNNPFHTDDAAFYVEMRGSGVLNRMADQGSGRLTWKDQDQRYLIVYNVGENSGWKLVKPIPYSIIYQTATTTRNLSILIGLILLVISIILVTFIANAITRPLRKLSYQMGRFSDGTFDAEAQVKGRDEIAYLNRQFNQMVRRTNDLINERYRMKLVEKNAILKALEAEINPHFLYNALQAISTKALKNEMYDIADMVDALALTFRYCISGKDIVLAKEEMEHVERYLTLQKARFGSRLNVEIRWEEELYSLKIPKLSLQTLVENSIKHGLERVSTEILISIEARLTDTHAVISVMDNGPGFTPERLQEVLRLMDTRWGEHETDHIGLRNLNTRLKLLYGEEARIEIETEGPLTVMKMLIPRGDSSHV